MESDEPPWEDDNWFDSCGRPTKPMPPILYYYCSVDAFIKIITNKTLWLTNLFFLNDSQEHFWLRNKARNFIAQQIQHHPDDEGYQWLDMILRQEWLHEIYCACFSEQSDLLNQWRAYGDDGKGVAIGFSTDHLQRLCKNLQGILTNVIYDDGEQDLLVERVFDIPPRMSDGEDPTIEQAAGTILKRTSEAASRCKSSAFSQEAEWRLASEPFLVFDSVEATCWTKATVPRFMERKGVITPYLEIPLVEGDSYRERGMEPIKEVWFGPKNTAKEQEYAASAMLQRSGFVRVRFIRSSVSYR